MAAKAEVIGIVGAYRLEIVRTRLKETASRYAYLEKYDRERLIRVDVDNHNRVVGEEIVAIGTVNATLVSPREVFKGAILNSATSIIVIHNHPIGQVEPSADDEEINEKLKEAGELLGIPVIDFVIIGDNERYWSSGSGVGVVYLKVGTDR